MKKIIIIPNNKPIVTGSIIQVSETLDISSADGLILDTPDSNVDIYIVDTEEYIAPKQPLLRNTLQGWELIDKHFGIEKTGLSPRILISENGEYGQNISMHDIVKVIATSNPLLPIPQLSKEAIKTIIKANGMIEEFDIDFGNGNTSCHNCSLHTSSACEYVEECLINNKGFIPIANIILPITETSNQPPQHLYWEIQGKPILKEQSRIDYILKLKEDNPNMSNEEIALAYSIWLKEIKDRIAAKNKPIPIEYILEHTTINHPEQENLTLAEIQKDVIAWKQISPNGGLGFSANTVQSLINKIIELQQK